MNKCFIQLQQVDDSDVCLFLFPFAGGTIQSYKPLIKSGRLYSSNIYALELPGRGVRMGTPSSLSIDEIKEECLHFIEPFLSKKIVFMGHSMGAIVAYELLASIEAQYPDLKASLVVSSAQAPRTVKAKYDVNHMNDDEFKDFIKRMGGIPDQISQYEEVMRFFIQRIRSDFKLLQNYHAANIQVLNSPISFIAAKDDPLIEETCVLDWAHYTRASFKMAWLHLGGHFYFLNDQTLLIDGINQALWELSGDRQTKS